MKKERHLLSGCRFPSVGIKFMLISYWPISSDSPRFIRRRTRKKKKKRRNKTGETISDPKGNGSHVEKYKVVLETHAQSRPGSKLREQKSIVTIRSRVEPLAANTRISRWHSWRWQLDTAAIVPLISMVVKRLLSVPAPHQRTGTTSFYTALAWSTVETGGAINQCSAVG